jgi:hypothetical protein
MEINTVLLEQGGISSAGVADFLLQGGYCLFRLEFRRLVPWDPAKHTDFCDALCLPGERGPEVLRRLAKEGFELAR